MTDHNGIPEFKNPIRYTVSLNSIPWAIDVSFARAQDAILEMMIKQVADPTFLGDIIVRPILPHDQMPADYGAKCEDDLSYGGSNRRGHLQSVGRVGYHNDRAPEDRSKHKATPEDKNPLAASREEDDRLLKKWPALKQEVETHPWEDQE